MLVIVLTVLPRTDLKIIQKFTLIKRDGRFGLGVLHSYRNSWNGYLNTVISLKFCEIEFHVVNHA